jgi:hypothetical protein
MVFALTILFMKEPKRNQQLMIKNKDLTNKNFK